MCTDRVGRETAGYQILRGGRWSAEGCAYHLRTRVRNGCGPPLTGVAAERVVRSLLSWQDRGQVLLVAFVVMPDHVHVLAVLRRGCSLQESFGRWKSWSAREINAGLGRRGSVWQPGFFDHRIRAEEDVGAIGRYIEHNPVRSGLAPVAEAFLFSSASQALSGRMRGRQWLVASNCDCAVGGSSGADVGAGDPSHSERRRGR
jgi:putative transposase